MLYFMRCPHRRMYSLCLCSLCGCASPGEAAVPRVMSTQAPGPRITSTPRLPKDQKLGRDIAPASLRQQGNDFPLSSQTLLAPTRHDSEKDRKRHFKYFPMYLGLYLNTFELIGFVLKILKVFVLKYISMYLSPCLTALSACVWGMRVHLGGYLPSFFSHLLIYVTQMCNGYG